MLVCPGIIYRSSVCDAPLRSSESSRWASLTVRERTGRGRGRNSRSTCSTQSVQNQLRITGRMSDTYGQAKSIDQALIFDAGEGYSFSGMCPREMSAPSRHAVSYVQHRATFGGKQHRARPHMLK